MKAIGRGTTATAMTAEEAFLQAIHANLADPAPWQMFADWLEERGDPTAILYRERQSTNALGMKFVTVPAGTFWMGGGGGKAGKEQCTVAAFQIGIYPVTQEQWEAVMGRNPSWYSRGGDGASDVESISDEELRAFPVGSVSWEDAQECLGKLHEKDRGSGWWYRLPSEAEWEYACRGGATLKKDCSYHFYAGEPSNSLSSTQANFNGNYPYGKAPKGPYLGRPTMVGSYPANRLGIFDMHGNVWEWCEDTVGGSNRVSRGGSWGHSAENCRAAYRGRRDPAFSLNRLLGLRLARVPSGQEAGKGLGPPGA